MKLKPVRLAPALIAGCVILVVCLFRLARPDFVELPELMTYDMRVRAALKFTRPPAATNLGFVYFDDATIAFLNTNRVLGYRFGLYWPRQIYGRLVEELSAEKAKAVALDIVFGELRPDHSPVVMADGRLMESDDFFALQMRRAGNVIIADTREVSPPELFATNALAVGDIITDTNKDSDGVLRRAQAFRVRRTWHPLFVLAQREFGIDLDNARISPRQLTLPLRGGGEAVEVALDEQGNFAPRDFLGEPLPAGMPDKAQPFVDRRIWHMGIVLAAQELKLDLEQAEVRPEEGKIVLRGENDTERVLPVDRQNYFYVDWSLLPTDEKLTSEPFQEVLIRERLRLEAGTNALPAPWAGKLIVVGSSATGNDLTDRGSTPLHRDTLLVSQHWNVANSMIVNRFIRRSSLQADCALIGALGILSWLLTWRYRALAALFLIVLSVVAYGVLSYVLYVRFRLWLPLVLPVGGGMVINYVCLVTWRAVFEESGNRRLKSIFSTVVSPKIMEELLKAERLSLGGARREVTVFFADVRGFTEFTDTRQEEASAYVAEHRLSREAAEAFYDEQARETLYTINLYLGLIADTVVRHDATLDKFIGDCVMAFWGAPTPNSRHAVSCVRAAIEAQRAVDELNRRRELQNRSIEAENATRAATGLPPNPLLPTLVVGTGINTGVVTVGIMGSETQAGVRQGSYTVFGREVNLASRLESLSGRNRILISEATYCCLVRDDPSLASTCIAQPDANVKGIRSAVKVYEVPWNLTDAPMHSPAQGSAVRQG